MRWLSFGLMRFAAAGSTASSSRCTLGQPDLAAIASISSRIGGVGPRQLGDALGQGAKVHHGAADQQRNTAARDDLFYLRAGVIATNSPAE